MPIHNAKVVSTFLGFEDHGVLTAFLNLDFGGYSQSFGGYQLKASFIQGVLKTLEVQSWESLPGEIVRIEGNDTQIHRIGHAIKNQWFDPRDVE